MTTRRDAGFWRGLRGSAISRGRAVTRNSSTRNVAVRMATLPVTAAASLVVARLAVETQGPRTFGLITTVIGFTSLLAFADLGMGAALANAVAGRAAPEAIYATTVSSLRTLGSVTVVLTAVAGVLSLVGVWPTVLGISDAEINHLNRDMFLLLALFAVGVTLSAANRVLMGADKYHLVLLQQVAASFLTLTVVLSLSSHATPTLFILAPAACTVVSQTGSVAVAVRILQLPIRRIVRGAVSSSVRKVKEVGASARPMLVINAALPLALQTDKLVLSHFSSRGELAAYSLANQLYVPLWSLFVSAGFALWPRFARSASPAEAVDGYRGAVRSFGLGALAAAVLLVGTGPLATKIWSGVSLPRYGIWAALALLLVVQALHLPAGMFLTDVAGLRIQAVSVTAMVVVNLGLSVPAAMLLGAPGPLLASAVSVAVCQLFPMRRTTLRRAQAAPRWTERPHEAGLA